MNLYHFAQNILESADIEEKLRHPGKIDYSPSKKVYSFPTSPQRSDAYAFGKKESKKLHLGELNSERDRGLLLLMFMNHELLAIELMAQAILKFHQSVPESFLRGLVQTIIDEQKHCRLYLKRLRELSCKPGDLPLSSFFWDCLSQVESPQAYLAGMSLTLEQANLDFTYHYREVFSSAGDKKTADILKTVYDDEIRHVQFGVDWMNKWNHDSSFWDYYLQHLPKSLDPNRAKANQYFDMNGRLAAKMDKETILKFKLHSSSRGRSPNIWIFNPAAELESHKISAPKSYTTVENDLIPLLIPLCKKDDILLSNESIDINTLEVFYNLKFPLPENFCFSQIDQLLSKHKPGHIKAWGKSPTVERKTSSIKQAQSSTFKLSNWKEPWKDLYSKKYQAKVYSKLSSDNLALDFSAAHYFSDIDDLSRLSQSNDVLLKQDLASTGRGCRRVFIDALEDDDLKWIKGALKRQGGILFEPYRDRLLDFSAQYEINSEGKLKFHGLTQIETKAFANTANTCGPFHHQWPNEIKSFVFHGGQHLIRDGFHLVAQEWSRIMQEMNFTGPFALDGFIWRDNKQLYFRPICELNPRLTMGRLALELNRSCQAGLLTQLSISDKSCLSDCPQDFQFKKQNKISSADLILNPHAKQFFARFKSL
ncbi:DUF455 family protein [Lentisphaera marina]|uniref:DUF455 family protein n=1 Tax=Lentisphaera marina TaxID=1111041 RepID=UPI0023650B60|nr:DUF455 family protein [Lentisphaera marina]MDD7986516.1 DUF455 family protein [Lentisphaera marina]